MGLKLFCKHITYDVIKWQFEDGADAGQFITAQIRCKICGKLTEKHLEGDNCRAFAAVYAGNAGPDYRKWAR